MNSLVQILAISIAFPALTATNSPTAVCTAFGSNMLMSTCFVCPLVKKDAAADSDVCAWACAWVCGAWCVWCVFVCLLFQERREEDHRKIKE